MSTYNKIDIFNFFNIHHENLFSTSIHEIKSKKARNLLRGISNPKNYNLTIRALTKIKKNCTSDDYKKAVAFVRTNQIFDGNTIGQLFNSYCPRGLGLIDTTLYSVGDITRQIQLHEPQLLELAHISKELQICLAQSNLSRALDYCNILAEKKGVSVFLLRMIAYITNRYQLLKLDSREILDSVSSLRVKLMLSNNITIVESITQLSNVRTSHLAIHKRISDLKGDYSHIYIAKSFIKPIPENKQEFIKTLNAFYAFSLFDAFLYLKRIQDLDLGLVDLHFDNHNLSKAYQKISAVEFRPVAMYESMNEDIGFYYLRECFLFLEQRKALNFSVIHGFYYTEHEHNTFPSEQVRKIIERYYGNLSGLSDIRQKITNEITFNFESYDKAHCGMLENSTALIHVLNKKQGNISADEELLFVQLMSSTKDIGYICNEDILLRIADSATTFALKLVARCLIYANNKKSYSEFELRTVIQEYCIAEFNNDLTSLLKHLFQISPAVTEHLILSCNETFLSTLFHLMDKPVEAIKVRADMLQWFGETIDDERYVDRAKTLRIDIQIKKEKDTIDDSRIYVDPLKFTQWFEDNMVNKLSMTLDNLMIGKDQQLVLEWQDRNNSLNHADELIECLLACYHEFCTNNMFGIASYLGRRIRHGTFIGTALTEVQNLIKKDEYQIIFEDKDFLSRVQIWLDNYEKMLLKLRETSLHIKSRKKPNGVITTEVDSQVKKYIANQMVFEIIRLYSTSTGFMRLPSLIIDFCWRLVEFDLRKVRNLLSEKKTEAIFSYNPKSPNQQHLKRDFAKFCQEANLTLTTKFGLMSSWFNKPSYASPSTDIYLLFRAVISEVKENVSHFEPKLDINEKIFQINGGSYYVIYDALYVLIHNAATHGKSDGSIIFNVDKAEERNALKIVLCTQTSSEKQLNEAFENIQKVVAVADEDAYVIESNSGIKKLKKMEREGSISDFRLKPVAETFMLQFEFFFELNVRDKYEDSNS